jgi:hypothetical protein
VFQDDTPEDKAAIQRVLNQVMVYPLTEFNGQMKTRDWSKSPSFPAPAGAGTGETKWVLPEKFFDQLPQVLQTVPPLPGEEALYGTIKSVLDAAAKDPQIKAILTQTAVASEDELIKPLFEFRNNGRHRKRLEFSAQRRALGHRLSIPHRDGKVEHVRQRAGRNTIHLY